MNSLQTKVIAVVLVLILVFGLLAFTCQFVEG